ESGFTHSDLLMGTYSVCRKISKSEWFGLLGYLHADLDSSRIEGAKVNVLLRTVRLSSMITTQSNARDLAFILTQTELLSWLSLVKYLLGK
ncbi:hypothetical protein, partial [Lonsdalea quercina]|uniref:hypothetical protein n=1 Tax=Lonsdalea quercina TaxID=71657 RepID=UPI003974E95C